MIVPTHTTEFWSLVRSIRTIRNSIARQGSVDADVLVSFVVSAREVRDWGLLGSQAQLHNDQLKKENK